MDFELEDVDNKPVLQSDFKKENQLKDENLFAKSDMNKNRNIEQMMKQLEMKIMENVKNKLKQKSNQNEKQIDDTSFQSFDFDKSQSFQRNDAKKFKNNENQQNVKTIQDLFQKIKQNNSLQKKVTSTDKNLQEMFDLFQLQENNINSQISPQKTNNEFRDLYDFDNFSIQKNVKNPDEQMEDEVMKIQKYLRMPQILGEENILRLKKQKMELDQCKEEIEKQEKLKIFLNMQIEVLKEEYQKIFDIKEGFKDEIIDVKKQNIKVQRRIDDVELTIENMIQIFEGENVTNKENQIIKATLNPKQRQKLEAEKRKRQRELLKKKMDAGIDLIGDQQDINVNDKKQSVGTFEKIFEYIDYTIEQFRPFTYYVNTIKANYDNQISLYYEIVQLIFLFNFIVAGIFGYLVVIQFINKYNQPYDEKYPMTKICGYMWPCVYFYSRFTSDLQFTYLITCLSFVLVGMVMTLYLWIKYDKKAHYNKIFQEDGIKFGRQLINCWTWNIDDRKQFEDRKSTVVNELYLLLHEDIVKDEVSKRSKKEIFNIQLKRAASFVLIFIALSIGWTLIVLGSVYEKQIQDYFLNLTKNNFIGQWSSTLIMNILNYIIPWVLHKIDKLSSWDFASQEFDAKLWQQYYTGMLNILLFMIIKTQPIFESSNEIVTNEKIDSNKIECKEDYLVDEFLKLILGEYVLRQVFYLFWFLYQKITFYVFNKKDWRIDFEVEDELVWFLSINLMLWGAMSIYPVICFITLFINYFHLNYMIYVAIYQKKQPLEASNDLQTGTIMIKYIFRTFSIAALFYSVLFFVQMPRLYYFDKDNFYDINNWCGPFLSNNILSPIQEVGIFPLQDNIINKILFCYLVQFTVYVILVMVSYGYYSLIEILQNVRDYKNKDYDDRLEELQNKLNKLNIKENLLRQNRRF